MTREEAIEEIRYYCQDSEEIIEAINQFSEDCVSRQAMLKEIPRLWNSRGDKDYCMETLRDFVTELPPVTPTHIETVTEFADRCRECGREKVLDKIRAEIEQNAYPIVHGVNNHEKGMTLYGILQIIDKYKAESEGKEV